MLLDISGFGELTLCFIPLSNSQQRINEKLFSGMSIRDNIIRFLPVQIKSKQVRQCKAAGDTVDIQPLSSSSLRPSLLERQASHLLWWTDQRWIMRTWWVLTCPWFLHSSLFIYLRERELRDIGLLLNEALDLCSFCPTPEFDNSVKVIQDLRFQLGTAFIEFWPHFSSICTLSTLNIYGGLLK